MKVKPAVYIILRILFLGLSGAFMLIFTSEILRAALNNHATPIEYTVAQAQLPSVNGNCNAVGQDNSACNTYVAPRRLYLSQALKDQILEKMTSKKPVELQTIGSGKDQEIGSELQEFLTSNNFKIQRTSIGMLVPPPDHKISFRDAGDRYILQVAPSAAE